MEKSFLTANETLNLLHRYMDCSIGLDCRITDELGG